MPTVVPQPNGSSTRKFAPKMAAITLGLSFTAGLFHPTPAHADGYWRSVANNAITVAGTAHNDLTVDQEVDRINQQWDEYNRQRDAAKAMAVPQVQFFLFSGPNIPIYPLYRYNWNDTQTLSMGFAFIDPKTGLGLSPGFVPFEVRYQVLEFPGNIDPLVFAGLDESAIESLIRPLLKDVGSSVDAANNFRINFQISGFEPIFFAFPYDSSGNEIRGEATAGWMSTVSVPEPSTWTVMILGFGAAGAALRRRRHAMVTYGCDEAA